MTDDAFHLTALDARRYDFGNALRGYDRARVDQFREQVAEELERLSRANQELEIKARNFHEQLRAFRERDKALNDALISAQQLRGEIREQAQREAQLIIREAQGEAERSLEHLRNEIRRSEDELQLLWRNRRSYLAQLRSLMERELADLDNADMAPPPTGVAVRASDLRRDASGDALRDEARAALREPARDATRESTRDALRESARDATRELPRDAQLDRAAGTRGESDDESVRDIPRELVREFTTDVPQNFLEPVRESPSGVVAVPTRETLNQRPSLPTPSWLDVVEGE